MQKPKPKGTSQEALDVPQPETLTLSEPKGKDKGEAQGQEALDVPQPEAWAQVQVEIRLALGGCHAIGGPVLKNKNMDSLCFLTSLFPFSHALMQTLLIPFAPI